MHDELIYEVPEENKQDFTRILKEIMEGTVKLKVPLPVKVRSGYTWGTLQETKLSIADQRGDGEVSLVDVFKSNVLVLS